MRVWSELSGRNGHTATVSEVAEKLGISEDEVRRAHAAMAARTPASLDAGTRDRSEEPVAPGIAKKMAGLGETAGTDARARIEPRTVG